MRLYVLVTLFLLKVCHGEQFDTSEFLFENAKICGEPFADPVWIPVLDLCDIECDAATTYCVENEELQQMCKPLPDECQSLLKLRMSTKAKVGVFENSMRGDSDEEDKVEARPNVPASTPILRSGSIKKPAVVHLGEVVRRPSPPMPQLRTQPKPAREPDLPSSGIVAMGPVGASAHGGRAPPTDLSNPPPGALGLFPLFKVDVQEGNDGNGQTQFSRAVRQQSRARSAQGQAIIESSARPQRVILKRVSRRRQ